MSFLPFLLISIGTWLANGILGVLMRPRPDNPKASALGDFQLPTVDATRPIPIACGTVLLKGPNVLWDGDLLVHAEKTSVGGFFGIGSTDVVTGYRYYLGMQLGLCQGPIDVFRDIWYDEKPLGCTQSVLGDHLRVVMPKKLLGIIPVYDDTPSGAVDLYKGTSSQGANDYLEAAIGSSLPGYRTLAYAAFRKTYVGKSSYLKNFAFEVSLYPNTLGLTGSKHIINTYDANPACFLYNLIINQDWGADFGSSRIDLASFQAAGNALFDEGLGISVVYDSQGDTDQLVQDILRHIDAVIYKDPLTGLVTMRLIRDDYDPLTIPVLDESMIVSMEFSRPSWSELKNTVLVTYVSRADQYTRRTASPQQNLAAIQIMGAPEIEQMEFLGASTGAVANLIGAREVKAVSYPLARASIKVHRQAWDLTPGAPFKVNYAPYGIAGMIFRVAKPSYGELESPDITLEAVEDIFGLTNSAYAPPGPSGWVNPVSAPVPVAAQRLIEVPYHLLAGTEDREAGALAVRGQGADQGYQVWSDRAGGTAYEFSNTVVGFTASALLNAAYPVNTAATHVAGFTVDGAVDLELLDSTTDTGLLSGSNLALIDDEIVSFETVTDNGDGTWTIGKVMRGVLDTVPAAHADNARVWFFRPGGLGAVDAVPYPADGTITAKLLPFNALGALAIASASATSVTTASRAKKPYPPGNVKVNGSFYPATVTAGVDAPVTWAHRHRVTQLADDRVVAQDAGNYVATPEGDYTIEIRVGGGSPVRTVTALTGTSWTWTAAFQAADGATAGQSVSIRVIPVNGSLVGNYQERLFTMA